MPAATGGGGGGSTGGSTTSQDRHPGAGNLNREDSSATGNKDCQDFRISKFIKFNFIDS